MKRIDQKKYKIIDCNPNLCGECAKCYVHNYSCAFCNLLDCKKRGRRSCRVVLIEDWRRAIYEKSVKR